MTTTRYEVFSYSPFTATFRTVRSERMARLFIRLYRRMGYADVYGTPLTFDYAPVGQGWIGEPTSVKVSFHDGRPSVSGVLLSVVGSSQIAIRTDAGETVGIATSMVSAMSAA